MKRKILLVDDDPAVLAGLGEVLLSEGYDVLPAADGDTAVATFQQEEIDLVLLDLNMPKKKGWDTFAEITEIDPLAPVVVITASPNQFATAVKAGVGALIEKPLDIPFLLKTMRALIRESHEVRLARQTGREARTSYSYCPAPANHAGQASRGRLAAVPEGEPPAAERPLPAAAPAAEPESALRALLKAWKRCTHAERRIFLQEIDALSNPRSFFL